MSRTSEFNTVRADLGGHLKYSQRWSGVRAGVLLGAQGAVRRGESRGGLREQEGTREKLESLGTNVVFGENRRSILS